MFEGTHSTVFAQSGAAAVAQFGSELLPGDPCDCSGLHAPPCPPPSRSLPSLHEKEQLCPWISAGVIDLDFDSMDEVDGWVVPPCPRSHWPAPFFRCKVGGT